MSDLYDQQAADSRDSDEAAEVDDDDPVPGLGDAPPPDMSCYPATSDPAVMTYGNTVDD